MSMRAYGMSVYGLYLTEADIREIASKICADYSDEAYEKNKWDFIETVTYDYGYAEECSNFSGEAFALLDDGRDDYGNSVTLPYDETIYYLEFSKYPMLFGTAYNSIHEIVVEMRDKLGSLLPSDFDYRSNLRHIVGTYFG